MPAAARTVNGVAEISALYHRANWPNIDHVATGGPKQRNGRRFGAIVIFLALEPMRALWAQSANHLKAVFLVRPDQTKRPLPRPGLHGHPIDPRKLDARLRGSGGPHVPRHRPRT